MMVGEGGGNGDPSFLVDFEMLSPTCPVSGSGGSNSSNLPQSNTGNSRGPKNALAITYDFKAGGSVASGRTEALCSADLVLGVGVTEMSKICHGRASGGSHPNERLSQSTQSPYR